MFHRLGRSVLLLAALTACSDSTSPEPPDIAEVVGVYELKSIDGVPLPAPYALPTSSYAAHRLSSTLTLLDDGTGTWEAVSEDDATGETTPESSTLTWELDGANLSVTFDCPGLASCIAGPHLAGTVADITFTVTASPLMRVPQVYEVLPNQM